MNAIDGTEDVLDSRDIIERIDTLQRSEPEDLTPEEVAELAELLKLANECECYADWQYGETLVARDYWVAYITDLIDECYDMPKPAGAWPYYHLRMDYEAAAEEAEQDYASVYLFGNEYLIRC